MDRIMVIFGTRPEAIKVAPVIKALQEESRFDLVTVATAQHRHMLDQVLKLFDITPDVDLNMLTPRQTLGGMTERLLAELVPLLSCRQARHRRGSGRHHDSVRGVTRRVLQRDTGGPSRSRPAYR